MRKRDKHGRYARAYRVATRFDKFLLVSILGGILFGIIFEIVNTESNMVVHVAEARVEEKIIPREVMIEVRIDWTEERIIEEINKVFPDAPIMIKVAKCESSLKPSAYNPTNSSHDKGIFQISEKYHGERIKELGLDMYGVIDNLHFARLLYNEQGLKPWIWSKPCWNK